MQLNETVLMMPETAVEIHEGIKKFFEEVKHVKFSLYKNGGKFKDNQILLTEAVAFHESIMILQQIMFSRDQCEIRFKSSIHPKTISRGDEVTLSATTLTIYCKRDNTLDVLEPEKSGGSVNATLLSLHHSVTED